MPFRALSYFSRSVLLLTFLISLRNFPLLELFDGALWAVKIISSLSRTPAFSLSPEKCGKPGSPISLEWGVEATQAVLTASDILNHDEDR
jgi:hypothetical protein